MPNIHSTISNIWTGSQFRRPLFSLVSLVISAIALLVSIWTLIRIPPERPVLCEDPGEFIRIRYDYQSRRPGYLADHYYEYVNRKEILRTLKVVNAYTNGNACVALYKYSVGNKVFHRSDWFVKVLDKYWLPHYVPSIVEGLTKDQVSWIRWKEEEITEWEKTSAKTY